MGKASTKAQNKYIAKTYDRVNLTFPKGTLEKLKAVAGDSVNAYIREAVYERMERDTASNQQTIE